MIRLLAALLGLAGMAAGAVGVHYSLQLPELTSPYAEGAAERLAGARAAMVRFAGDAERVANLVPAVQRAVAELGDSAAAMGSSLDELGEGFTAIASAMRRMGADLTTMGASLRPLVGGNANLAETAAELRDAATRLDAAAAQVPAMSRGLQNGAAEVTALAESLGTVPLSQISAGVAEIDGELAGLETMVREGRVLAAVRTGGLVLSGWTAFHGLCMLVIAMAIGSARRAARRG